MDAEESALIAAVVATPDDDTVRLVYADWLEEHGRHDRGRLIRVQCAIERLQAEETALLEKYNREWGRELYVRGAHWWKFHRGFPEEISIPISNFIHEYHELNSFTPLRYLKLNGATDENIRLFSFIPALTQTLSLEIDQATENGHLSGRYGMAGVEALASSKYLANLRRLSLHAHQIGEAEAMRIAQSPTFANLTHLTLSAPGLEAAGQDFLLRLVNAPNQWSLQSLRLASEEYGSQVLRQLRRTTLPPNVAP
jgi:uncharacterized protein (TIGR02996 family)